MALVAQRPNISLRPGFAPLAMNNRRFPERNQDNVLTGAEITTPVRVNIKEHTDRAANVQQYPAEEVLGSNIGHDYANLDIVHHQPVFSLTAPTKRGRGKRFEPDRQIVFTGMVGMHFGGISNDEELEDAIVFRGFSAGALSWRGGRTPDPVLSVRIAGAGTAELTGNDIVEPGDLVTYTPHSLNPATRKAELEAIQDPIQWSKQSLVPVLRALRPTELVDFIGDAAGETFFDENVSISHDYSKMLNLDELAKLSTKKQIMLSLRLNSAFTGFAHILTAIQMGIVVPNAAGLANPKDAAQITQPNTLDFNEIPVDVVMRLAAAHGLTGEPDPAFSNYLDYSFARAYRGILPLGAHPQIEAASNIEGLLEKAAANSFAGSRNASILAARQVLECQNMSAHAIYNNTTAAYWKKRSRAICMATTGAGPRTKFNYLLLLS